MKWLLYLLPLVCLAASPFNLQKDPTVASWGGSAVAGGGGGTSGFYPTNIAGYPAASYFNLLTNGTWTSNSNIRTWVDLTGNALNNQTNVGFGGAKCPVRNDSMLGSFAALCFTNATTFLVGLQSNVQPFEIVCLISITNNGQSDAPIFCSDSDANILVKYQAGNNRITTYGGNNFIFTSGFYATNTWFVLDVVFNGAGTTAYTNNVSGGSASNSGALKALCIGGGYAQQSPTSMFDLAELVVYGTNLSTAARDGLYNYFKTNYTAASLP